jgi:caffeoyl-CoA O-methyltransferase
MNFIDPEIENYAREHTTEEAEIFKRLHDETYAKMSAPQMQVGRIEGKFLQMLVRLMRAKRVLEIGMFTGYSTLMMAEGLPEDGQLITCEINSDAAGMAKRYFAENPHGSKIEIRMGKALDTMAELKPAFDMIFIDADKAGYWDYYERGMELLRNGGLIVADNTLRDGRVINGEGSDAKSIAEFNDKVQNDPRVENVCLTVRDGITLIYKKENS